MNEICLEVQNAFLDSHHINNREKLHLKETDCRGTELVSLDRVRNRLQTISSSATILKKAIGSGVRDDEQMEMWSLPISTVGRRVRFVFYFAPQGP